jgi:hypothetical protein
MREGQAPDLSVRNDQSFDRIVSAFLQLALLHLAMKLQLFGQLGFNSTLPNEI